MSKQEAVELLNEIVKTCMLPRYITLESSNPRASPETQNFQLRIGNHFDAKTWECLKGIVRKRGLSMKEKGDYVAIYKEEP
jgi:hypothetical protein